MLCNESEVLIWSTGVESKIDNNNDNKKDKNKNEEEKQEEQYWQ